MKCLETAAWLTVLLIAGAPARGAAGVPVDDGPFAEWVAPFVQRHCVACHDADDPSGNLRLDNLSADVSGDLDRWIAIRDQLRDGLMPPADEPRPEPAAVRKVVLWATAATGARPARLPNQGNLIPHEMLFAGLPTGPGSSPPRIWRLSPDAYAEWIRPVFKERLGGIVNPFTLGGDRGLKDYSGLHAVDEAITAALIRNAQIIVEAQTQFEIKEGKYLPGNHGAHRELVELMNPDVEPTRQQLVAAIQSQFAKAIRRTATDEEVDRYIGLYERGTRTADRPGAARTMLQAILLRPDAVYRYELGAGSAAGADRRLLSPLELEQAVSLGVGSRRSAELLSELTAAMNAGPQSVKAAIQKFVRQSYQQPDGGKARALEFCRQYFEYPRTTAIFKNKPDDLAREPRWLVSDTQHLIEFILTADHDVFRELLTTRRSFVNCNFTKNPQTKRHDLQARGHVPNERNEPERKPVESLYGFDQWPSPQPVELAADTRIGILMQPSWLVAWSTNFENDPVRRGRWIRERLLGGTVPELPIGVAAMVPDEPEHTLRQRLSVTREAKCWKCHQRMDDLGLPFEQFDHFGRWRKVELVRDAAATAAHVDKNGKPLGPLTRAEPLDATGRIDGTGDPRLDGPVTDAAS